MCPKHHFNTKCTKYRLHFRIEHAPAEYLALH